MNTIEFILKGPGSDLRVDFREPILIPEGFHGIIGLKGFVCYNSIPNLTWNKNNSLRIKAPGGIYETFKFPTGAYELSSIYIQLKEYFEEHYPDLKNVDENFILIGDQATSKTEIIFKDDYGINFDVDHSINNVLGFKKEDKFEGKGKFVSENIVNISSVTQLIFCCDVTEGGYVNDIQVPFLYNCGIDVPPGYQMKRELTKITYKVMNTRQICSIRCWILDEHGSPINLREDTLVVTLSLKFVKNE